MNSEETSKVSNRELIYREYLASLTDRERRECLSENNSDLPLPATYPGKDVISKNVRRFIEIVKSYSPIPDAPAGLSARQLNMIDEARFFLVCACFSFLTEYLPKRDVTLCGFQKLLSMEHDEKSPGYISPLEMIFVELESGYRYVRSIETGLYERKPSPFCRQSDGKRPCDGVRADGQSGFAVDEDDSLFFYTKFKQIRSEARKTAFGSRFIFWVKSSFIAINTEAANIFDERERQMVSSEKAKIELKQKAERLKMHYEVNRKDPDRYDLLQQLMIEAQLAYLLDDGAPVKMRESYIAGLRDEIGTKAVSPYKCPEAFDDWES